MTINSSAHQIEIADGIVLIKNQNTTIGYSRFSDAGDVEYIYVNPMYRRQGYGSLLLSEIQKATGQIGRLHEPISPLGAEFFKALGLSPSPSPVTPTPDAKAM